jgi:hypothetical protein
VFTLDALSFHELTHLSHTFSETSAGLGLLKRIFTQARLAIGAGSLGEFQVSKLSAVFMIF